MYTTGPWVRRFTPRPKARLRLFCFPYAGGGASLYRGWSKALPLEVEVCSIQLPGREDRLREAPITSISLLVQALSYAIRPYLDRPFAFWGHSMGALIAFELARQLRREVMPEPGHLFVSGRGAPQVPNSRGLFTSYQNQNS
jgi:surfactin synthase thioesterase subunit